jgi:peptidoglycan/LPS O-acetylase OafA/YrhL
MTRGIVRRALRILPVCFAYLLVVLRLTWVSPFWHPLNVWLSKLFFTTTFMLYKNWHGLTLPTIHLCSLGIEEQFCLIWPPLFAMSGGENGRRALLQLMSLALLVSPICRFVSFYELHGGVGKAVFPRPRFSSTSKALPTAVRLRCLWQLDRKKSTGIP